MRVRPVALILLLAASCSDGRTEGPAELVGTATLGQHFAFLGGLSGIELGPDGSDAAIVLDTGALVRGTIERDASGRPTTLARWSLVPIEVPADAVVWQRGLDTEGVAITDAGIFVSLERLHAVWRIGPDGRLAEALPSHPDFAALPENGSLEALAADADGALYVVPERSGGRSRPFPVWRYRDNAWSAAFTLPRRGRFLAVGADFGPDGRFYLLERRMPLPFRFSSRVRRFTIENGELVAEETLLETPLGMHDNLEGLAVWRDTGGAIRLTMVSDDNHSRFQETQIVEYRLPPELDGKGRGG